MGLVSGDSEMALRRCNILKMGEDAVSRSSFFYVTERKESIIITQQSAGCDLETMSSQAGQFGFICKVYY